LSKGIFMSNVPTDLRYLESHEWARKESDGTITVGISDHAQHALGDVVFVDVPDVGKKIAAGAAVAVVESVKAASDIYSPVAGEVVASNEALKTTPELINQEPYGSGWLMKIRPDDAGAYAKLLDAKGYADLLKDEEAH
jgi:glycine cleavage system H protein